METTRMRSSRSRWSRKTRDARGLQLIMAVSVRISWLLAHHMKYDEHAA